MTRSLATRWWKQAVVALTVVGIAALAYGPARYLLSREHEVTPSAISLFGDPYAPPSLAPWPTGIADTDTRGGIDRAAPEGRFLTRADALARPPGTAYVAVTGPAAGHALPGVGAVLGSRDVRTIVGLDEPERTDTIRYLTSTRGAGLGLFAMTGEPAGTGQLVTSRSSETRRKLLATGDPEVKELIDVSAQQRPDLSVLVTPPGGDESAALSDVGLASTTSTGRGPTDPTTAAYRDAVERAATREILPVLGQRREVVAPDLLTDHDGLFILGGDQPTATARGEAFSVAALAAPPGSKIAPVRASGGITAMAFERPRGGASVLVWNPGPAQRLTVDLPYGDRVHRVRMMVAAQALTAVLLAK